MTGSALMTTAANGARLQIDAALLSYCRGIDRLDPAAVQAAFHPGALLCDYGERDFSIETFVEHAMGSLERRFRATQHRISNVCVEFSADGSHALVETYVLAFHVEPTDDGDLLHTFNGRYIDRFTPVDGLWRIERRTLRNDWSKVEPIERPMSGTWKASGRAGGPDPLTA